MPLVDIIAESLFLPLTFLAIFIILYKINRASLMPSIFFTLFLISAAVVICLHMLSSNSAIAKIALITIAFIFLFTLMFGAYVLVVFLLLNSRAVLKRETRTLAHCLTLILATAIIAFRVAVSVITVGRLPLIGRVAMLWIEMLVLCYAAHVTQFIVAVVLCNMSRPKKNQDYVIIHGAWLKDGRVSPLLAGRVDRAIKFYEKQKKGGSPPKLIFSGGKGSDEACSEAEAMANYAREKGIPDGDMILEDQSVSTLENMRFSKRIMDERANGGGYRAIYVTSNYHLLRTGIYARWAGLKISGIGSKTAFYYLPDALLREYIAYFVIYWKLNVLFATSCFLFSCVLMALMTYFAAKPM